jgi:hypothetical protein
MVGPEFFVILKNSKNPWNFQNSLCSIDLEGTPSM